jgi:hypothetical protein
MTSSSEQSLNVKSPFLCMPPCLLSSPYPPASPL